MALRSVSLVPCIQEELLLVVVAPYNIHMLHHMMSMFGMTVSSRHPDFVVQCEAVGCMVHQPFCMKLEPKLQQHHNSKGQAHNGKSSSSIGSGPDGSMKPGIQTGGPET